MKRPNQSTKATAKVLVHFVQLISSFGFPSIVSLLFIGFAIQSFAANTDRAAAAIERREGVTIGGGNGSSFEEAIVVHTANLHQALLAGFEYIALRYGWFQITSGPTVRYRGKPYKVFTYQDHRAMGDPKPKRVFYFDVSEYLPTYSVSPEYPRDARDKGLAGKGVMAVQINRITGRVTSVSILKGTGHDILDNAALRAVRQWRYRPGGITSAEIPIQFTSKGVSY